MIIRQLCTPRSANVLSGKGERLFTIELPSQPFGYDVKKDESVWYQVDFLLLPGNAPPGSGPVKGNASIREFCELGCEVEELDRKSSDYLRNDSALSVREPIKGLENSNIVLFYREAQPWIHLKLLGVEFEETTWWSDMLNPVRELAESYQAEREAFEAKMKFKVERVGKSED